MGVVDPFPISLGLSNNAELIVLDFSCVRLVNNISHVYVIDGSFKVAKGT